MKALFFILALSGIRQCLASPSDTAIQHVSVVFKYSKNIFPKEWQDGAIDGRGEPIATEEIPRTKKILVIAMGKYPEGFFKADLKTVYFLKNLSFYGVGYGGTNSTAELYLTNNGTTNGYSDKYVEQTFHHEFSSILLRNHVDLMDTAAWKAASTKGFVYSDSLEGVGAIIKKETSQAIDTVFCKMGVLTQYALSGMENDVNTFAQNLFKPENRFWYVADHFPLIRTKVRLLIAFYNKLNPLFTEAFFRKFNNG